MFYDMSVLMDCAMRIYRLRKFTSCVWILRDDSKSDCLCFFFLPMRKIIGTLYFHVTLLNDDSTVLATYHHRQNFIVSSYERISLTR